MLTEIPITDIRFDDRIRKDMGDIDGLADSIADVGLLQPIVLDANKRLVAGRRRIDAFKKLDRQKIPYVTAKNLDDALQLIKAERDENVCRKPFTPEEAVNVGKRMAKFEKPKAAERRRATQNNKSSGAKLAPQDKGKTRDKAAAAAGMSHGNYEKSKAVVESGDRDLIDEMNRTGKVNGMHKKMKVAKQAEAINAEPPPLPEGPFRVIAVDPPWRYTKRAGDPSQRGQCPYPSMSIDEIKAMPIADLAHDDSVLWLWTTNAHFPEAFEIAEAWGFKYKTTLTWVKDRMGMGDWLRGRTEHVLMCVRGKPTVTLTNQTTVIHGQLREHSRKPVEFYELVEKLCPGSKVEIFSRENRDGWETYGDEQGLFGEDVPF